MINRRQQGGFWGALIGAGVSLFAGSRSSRNQRRQQNNADAFTDREIKLAERQDHRGQVLFDNYRRNYMPKEQEFLEDSFEGESAGLEEARAVADTRQAYSSARDQTNRRNRRYGINPASGVAQEQDRLSHLDEARTEVGARYNARQSVDDKNYQRRYSSLALGRNLPSQAGALTSSAMGANANAARLSEGRARRSGEDAASNYSAAGSAIGQVIDHFSNGG